MTINRIVRIVAGFLVSAAALDADTTGVSLH